jgi:hypothetical protein
MTPAEAIPGNYSKNDGGGEFNYDILYEILQMTQCTPSSTIKKEINKNGKIRYYKMLLMFVDFYVYTVNYHYTC